MNIVWWLIRKLYILGLVPVILLVLGFALDPSDRDVAFLVIGSGVAYFIVGWLLLGYLPGRLRARILARVNKYKGGGFSPRWEAVSVLFNRYLGFDNNNRQVLYVDVNDGTERLIDFDDLDEWELESDNNRTSLLKLMTRIPDLPTIGVRIHMRMRDGCRAHMRMIFS